MAYLRDQLNINIVGVNNINELEDEILKNNSIAVDFHHSSVCEILYQFIALIAYFLSTQIISIHCIISDILL